MKIAICTPLHGDPKAEYTKSLVDMCVATLRHYPALEIRYFLFSAMVQKARAELVKMAADWGADYLLFVDADSVFPVDALSRLLNHKTAIVAANYPRRAPPHTPVAVGLDRRPLASFGKTGTEEVLYVGLGLCLLEMKALLAIEGSLFRMVELPDGQFLSEDYYFCDRAREAGLKVMVDHDLSGLTGHVGSQVFTHRHSLVGMAQASLDAQRATEAGIKDEDSIVPAAGAG